MRLHPEGMTEISAGLSGATPRVGMEIHRHPEGRARNQMCVIMPTAATRTRGRILSVSFTRGSRRYRSSTPR